MDEAHCMLPFPSSFFLAEDPDTVTGLRVDFGITSLPVNDWGTPLDPTAWNRRDGFSTLGPLYALFLGLDVSRLPVHGDIGASVGTDSPTLILDATTGAPQPHFCELDAAAAAEPERQLLVLRPVAPLEHGRRYVVGLRGLVDADGDPLPAPAGFAALRDRLLGGEPDLERQRGHYEAEIFPVLAGAGVARADLQLAWDVVTVSAEGSLADPLTIRADALARLGEHGPPFAISARGSARNPK